MKYTSSLVTSFIALIVCLPAAHSAVHINPDGQGQVLIYPYYTVNNNLNTIYTVTNTTADTKAVKIRFMEGRNGIWVLDFNLYLDGYDSWTGVLSPTTSTIISHVGEPSAVHTSSDASCTPFLNTAGQEFLPYAIDVDPPETNMQRSREGYIEIIEMATFYGPTITWADHGITGVPANCAAIQADWGDNSIYNTGDEDLVTGGLVGHASLVNVAEGLAFSYPAMAIDDFWFSDIGSHHEPGSLFPSINQGDIEAEVLINNQIYGGTWFSGSEAFTAILQARQLTNEYDFDPLNSSLTEWVISFPTKRFHTDGPSAPIPPFSSLWDGNQSCDPYSVSTWDRDQQQVTSFAPRGNPTLCLTTNVIQFLPSGSSPPAVTALLGSHNTETLFGINNPSATSNGWTRLTFADPQQHSTPLSGDTLLGLPAVGFQVKQFTNQQAQPGLVAQYASSFNHKYQRAVENNR